MLAKRKELLIALLLVAMLAVMLALVSRVGSVHSKGETQFVEDAVRAAALTCYAVEGAYPERLEYLYENYGLAYDRDRYIVDYEVQIGNRTPYINVIAMEEDG